MSAKDPIRLLALDEASGALQRVLDELENSGILCQILRRVNGAEFDRALAEFNPDAVLSPPTLVARRSRTEARLLRLNRVCRMTSGINSAILRIQERQVLLDEICRLAVGRGPYQLAWIGLAEPDGCGVPVVASRFRGSRYREASAVPLDVADTLVGKTDGMTGDRPAFYDDLETSCHDQPAFASAIRAGLRSAAWLPLTVDGSLKGGFGLYADEAGIFDPEARRMLTELASDIAYAIDRLAKEQQRDYLALYDNLTGLANRSLFLDRLAQLIQRDGGAPFAVAVFDVDRFRHINETLSYEAGDFLLRELARRLSKLAPETCLGRPSGDDLALALTGVRNEAETACFISDRLLPVLTRPICYDGQELRIAIKVGVAWFPGDGADPVSLLAHAEMAHRGAKGSSEPLLFFAREMNQGAGEFLRMESRLRKAVEQQEFIVYYQPKMDLRDGCVNGMEALLRWRDPEQGVVPPAKFYSILEETGLVLDVGRWIIEEAGRQYLRWAGTVAAPPRIAVNISPRQLGQRSFVADVETALAACRQSRGFLELEITESAIMHNVEENSRKLHAIREMGVEITIDDFGTGYSSLSYLTRLPLTRLKIDKSFIVDMTESPDSLSIVSSIISLAHTLNLKVAAEGVETAEQLKFLKLLRCDEIQGFLLSPPVPPDEALRLGLGSTEAESGGSGGLVAKLLPKSGRKSSRLRT